MGLRQLFAPAVYPLTLSEARAQLRVDHSADDGEILRYLRTATAEVERLSARQIVDAKWRYTLREWPEFEDDENEIALPRAPLAAVDAITYLDGDGTRQALSASRYVAALNDEPGTIEPAYGLYWPAAREIADSIRIDYWAGMALPITQIDDDVFTTTGRPLATGDEVMLWSAGDTPTNLEAGKPYFVIGASASGAQTTFQLSTSSGGSAITSIGALGDSLWITHNWQLFATARQAVALLLSHRQEAREDTASEQSYQIPRGVEHLIEQLQYGAEFYRWSL